MNLSEIKQLAKDRGITPRRMRKAELIRALQAQEGNSPCYNSNVSQQCGQPYCLWRADCH